MRHAHEATRAETDRSAVPAFQNNRPGTGEHPRNGLEQRRLSGAVSADQRRDFPFLNGAVDARIASMAP
jgi:hypothetical protein